MSKTRKNLLVLFSFFCVILLGSFLYGEKLSYEQTAKELQQIVSDDLSRTKEYCVQNSSKIQDWTDYLSIEDVEKILDGKTEQERVELHQFLTTLKYSQGVDQYQVLVQLQESLNALLTWRESHFLSTILQGKKTLENLKSKRAAFATSEEGKALSNYAANLSSEDKEELESTFFASVKPELPCEVTKEEIHSEMEEEISEEAETSVRSPLHRRSTSFEQNEEPIETTSQSGLLGNTASAVRAVLPLPGKFRQNGNVQYLAQGDAQPAVSEAKTYIQEDPQDALKVPEFPELQEKDGESAIRTSEKKNNPTETIPTAVEEVSVKEPATEPKENEEDPKADSASDEEEFMSLPVLHYSLVGTVGANGNAPKLSGKTPADFLKDLKGDYKNDLAAVRQSWQAETFKAPTDADLDAAYKLIKENFTAITKELNRLDSKRSSSWKKCLHLNSLNLDAEPQLDVLREVYGLLSAGHVGLELEIFADFRESIYHFLALNAQKNDVEKAEKLFEAGRFRVLKLLELVDKNHCSINERALEDQLVWFEIMGQAESSVVATRRMWTRPNIVARIESSFFERNGKHSVEQDQPVSSQTSEATVQGKSHFVGELAIKPIENKDRIEFGIFLEGVAESRTNAYAGPVVITSRAKSSIRARKNVLFDEVGFDFEPANVQVRTNSQILGVQDRRGRGRVENTAWSRAQGQKAQMERSSSAQAERQLRTRLDKIDSSLGDVNKQITETFERNFRPRGLDSVNLKSWSDGSCAYLETHFIHRNGMSAFNEPPAMPQKSDLNISIHETALQSAFVGYFSGMRLDSYAREHLRKTAPSFVKNLLKDQKKPDNQDDSWALRFVQDWPISVSIQDGKVTCVIHCEGLDYEGKNYPAVDVTICYGIQVRPDGIYFVRDKEIGIFPPDFDPGQQKRLPPSMISLRKVLGKRLDKSLESEFLFKEQDLQQAESDKKEGADKKEESRFGNYVMKPVFAQSKDGWLQVGINLVKKDEK